MHVSTDISSLEFSHSGILAKINWLFSAYEGDIKFEEAHIWTLDDSVLETYIVDNLDIATKLLYIKQYPWAGEDISIIFNRLVGQLISYLYDR